MLWLQSLFAAIDLAPPLDDRQIPRDLSIPRPRRRRAARTTATNMERNAALVAEQQEILRTQYPRLAATIPEDEGTGENEDDADIPSEESAPVRSSPNTSASEAIPTPTTGISGSTALISRARAARNLVSAQTPNPSIEPETGKWQPHHQWTPLYDMQYAKRCMAVLTSRSPRKSNFVIMKGKQWIVDWATGRLTRWEPPEYGEVEGSSRLRINQQGEIAVLTAAV